MERGWAMHNSAIYNPRARLTHSQLKAAEDHRVRLDKIASRANVVPIKVTAPPLQVEVKTEPAFSLSDWIERQKALHPLPKQPWFSIEAEIDPPEPAPPRIEAIQRVVAKHYGVTRNDLICARRTQNFVMPRHVAMWFCRSFTMKSFPEIGRRFGRRDHTVPIYACRKIDELIKTNATIAADVTAITAILAVS